MIRENRKLIIFYTRMPTVAHICKSSAYNSACFAHILYTFALFATIIFFAAEEGFERYENISAICDKKVCKKRKKLLAATRCLVSARAACFFALKLRRKQLRIMPAEDILRRAK